VKYCKKCDKELSENFKHCPDCGSKLSDIVREIVKEEIGKKHSEKVIEFDLFAKKTIFSIIIVVAAIIALGFVIANPTGLISLVNPNGTTTTSTIITTTTAISNFDISVKVVNEYTGKPVSGAVIYFDGSDVGVSGTDGNKIIKGVLKGSHNLEVSLPDKGVSSKTTIDIYPTTTFEIKLKAPVDVMLTLTDKETGKVVSYSMINLEDRNGKSIISKPTTQEGTVLLNDVLPGDYRVGVHVIGDNGQEIVVYSQYKSLGISDRDSLTVDMPNPILEPSGKLEFIKLYTSMKCKIEIANRGNYVAKNPLAVCLVYEIDGNKLNLIGSKNKVFTNIAPGSMLPEETDTMGNNPLDFNKKDVVIVVYDSNPYSPSQEKQIEMQVPQSIATQVISEVHDYCKSNGLECAKIAGTFVGTAIKTVTGGS